MLKLSGNFMKKKFKLKISVWQFLALGYFAVILLGSILLILPFATSGGESTSYLNALFTATSATCVTGLSPYDAGTHWSLFGQIVILLLIQFGGLGFMTFVSVVLIAFGKGLGIYSRTAFIESTGGRKYSGFFKLVRRIFIGSFLFEFIGAALLSIRFIGDFGAARGIYFAIFHSISAFCNAGFDLMGSVGGASLTEYAADPLVSLTVSGLIIMGGIGFCVWNDVLDCRFNPKKLQLNTKIVLLVSAIFLILSTGLLLVFEWDNAFFGEKGFNFGEKLLACFFHACTTRTAGFYSTPIYTLSDSGYLLTLILMFIGGSSGSTAGGIKVGTFAVIIMGMVAVFRGKRDIDIGKKRIEHSLLSQALAIFAAFLMIVSVGTLIICAVEPEVTFKEVLFECVSALGTVGLSLNLTPHLGIASKIVLILLMYAGRVGILTLALALGEKRTTAEIRKPVDTLLIG